MLSGKVVISFAYNCSRLGTLRVVGHLIGERIYRILSFGAIKVSGRLLYVERYSRFVISISSGKASPSPLREISYNPFSRLQEKRLISSIFWPKGLLKPTPASASALINGIPLLVFTYILTLSSFPSALKVISSFVKFAFLMSPIKSVGAFGKSACSVAVAAAGTADSATGTCGTTVVCANLFSTALGIGQPPFQLILSSSAAV